MKKNKIITMILVSGIFLVPGSLYALKGTAIRRITNFSSEEFLMWDSNGEYFQQGPAAKNQYGVLIPTQTMYHSKNDPEIKQNEQSPARIYLFDMSTIARIGSGSMAYAARMTLRKRDETYSLSDYDWRVWLMAGNKRSNVSIFDKQALKKAYKSYRINIAKKSLGALAEGAKAYATGTMPNLDLAGLADLANKPETKDVRLYIMPDDSIIFTADYEGEGDTPTDVVVKDLVVKYDASPNEDYRYLYQEIIDQGLRTQAYRDELESR